MKRLFLTLFVAISAIAFSQNHSKKPIRFIFESIHDHLGNLDVNSKRVKLFSVDHLLIYEADMYEGKELDEQFFYYDADRKLVRDHRIFSKEHESGDYRMKYNEKGNLIEETNVDDLGRVLERKTMTYDGNGRMLTKKVEFLHTAEARMITESWFEYAYNSSGVLQSKTGWENEKEDQKVTYKYQITSGSEVVSKFNSANELQEKWEKTYDASGRLMSDNHSVYADGKSQTKTIDFTYDQFDHILTETLSKSGSQVRSQIIFDYVYDDFGNWIERREKKVMGVRETEGVTLKRQIEYYESDVYEHPPMELDESYEYEDRGGKKAKVFQESHTRINNNEGQLEWVVRRNGPDLFQVDEYEYEEGKLVRINHLNHNDKQHSYTLVSYNDKGWKTDKASYSADGNVDERTLYAYNDKGQVVKKEEQFTKGSCGPVETAVTQQYAYNDAGKRSEMKLSEYGADYDVTYEYDDAGHLVKEVQTPKAKNEEVYTTVYTYEGDRLKSKEHFEGKAKDAHDKTVYTYDSHNELIKSERYLKGALQYEVDYVYFD